MQVHVRGIGVDPGTTLEEHAERAIHFALSRFGTKVRRVHVRLYDENGPKGGVDKVCRVILQGPTLTEVVETRQADWFAAVSEAAEIAGRTVARSLRRARTARRGSSS